MGSRESLARDDITEPERPPSPFLIIADKMLCGPVILNVGGKKWASEHLSTVSSSTSYISPIGLTSHQMLLSSGHSIHKLEPRLFQTWSEMGHTGQVPNIQAGETQALRHTQRWGEDKFKLNAKNDFWFQDWRSCVTPTLCSTVNTILTDLLATLTRSWASTGPTSCTSPRGWGPSARQLVFIG